MDVRKSNQISIKGTIKEWSEIRDDLQVLMDDGDLSDSGQYLLIHLDNSID